jgi:hypothetical protein
MTKAVYKSSMKLTLWMIPVSIQSGGQHHGPNFNWGGQ